MTKLSASETESGLSRRDFLTTTAAVVGASALPFGMAQAGPAMYRRVNVMGPDGARALDSYKKAIRAMIALPPEDPRNWYRNALVHFMDCPHGNWWFLVWHRGYLGWFEQTCRELSGDTQFALPYWDWTTEQQVPSSMFDDVLTPTNPAYIPTAMDFKTRFQAAVANAHYWQVTNPFRVDTPYAQLLLRGIRNPDDLWFDINDDPRGKQFFDRANARGLTKEHPDFDGPTKGAVSLPRLLDSLAPRDFLTFASPKTFYHGGLTGFGVLEGQPHNRVHNCVGGFFTGGSGQGFMQANLSPVDPIFFLHHANIDRLWDVWTRKQQARRYPTLANGYPTNPGDPVERGTDYYAWSTEPFVFFVDAQGQPVSQQKAGDYQTIGDFSYSYEPASGEEVVPVPVAATSPTTVSPPLSLAAKISAPFASAANPAHAAVTIPGREFQTGSGADEPQQFAKITLALPPFAHKADLRVLISAPDAAANPEDEFSLSMFGHHTISGPVTFTVPVSRQIRAALARSSAAAASSNAGSPADTTLNFRIVAQGEQGGHIAATHATVNRAGEAPQAQLLSVVVETH